MMMTTGRLITRCPTRTARLGVRVGWKEFSGGVSGGIFSTVLTHVQSESYSLRRIIPHLVLLEMGGSQVLINALIVQVEFSGKALCTTCVQEGGLEGPENGPKQRRINNRLLSYRPKSRNNFKILAGGRYPAQLQAGRRTTHLKTTAPYCTKPTVGAGVLPSGDSLMLPYCAS